MNKLQQVFSALVASFHGVPLPSMQGHQLQSGTEKTVEVPSLIWRTGSWTSSDWTPDEYQLSWDLPVELTVRGEHSDHLPIQGVIGDLYWWCECVKGLPVTSEGVVVPSVDYGPDGTLIDSPHRIIDMFEDGKLETVAKRFIGPNITKVSVRTLDSDTLVADININVQFTVEPREEPIRYPTAFVLGLMPSDIMRTRLPLDV